jgi:hypothetical protein
LARLKAKKRRKYSKGRLLRALVVRSKVNFLRMSGIFIKFDENTVVLVNKRVVPISNRVYGPILKELCMRWPSLGCVLDLLFNFMLGSVDFFFNNKFSSRHYLIHKLHSFMVLYYRISLTWFYFFHSGISKLWMTFGFIIIFFFSNFS